MIRKTTMRVCWDPRPAPTVRLTVADTDVPSPSQILPSIEGARRAPALDALRVQTTAMPQILGYQRPLGPTVRSELSMLK
jgi:hypothetical protein